MTKRYNATAMRSPENPLREFSRVAGELSR